MAGAALVPFKPFDFGCTEVVVTSQTGATLRLETLQGVSNLGETPETEYARGTGGKILDHTPGRNTPKEVTIDFLVSDWQNLCNVLNFNELIFGVGTFNISFNMKDPTVSGIPTVVGYSLNKCRIIDWSISTAQGVEATAVSVTVKPISCIQTGATGAARALLGAALKR